MSKVKCNNRRGTSLTLITGLVALLMVSSAAVSQLIIRSLQSSQRIVASNMAYLAAEAGIEDALYELSPHFAGYQTANTRNNQLFTTNNTLRNEWNVIGRSDDTEWSSTITKNQKVMVYLYYDNMGQSVVDTNAIDSTLPQTANISALNVSGNMGITFTLPEVVTDEIGAAQVLAIDNDNDLPTAGYVNEDGTDDDDPSCANPSDGDCDGLVDEDSDEDAVILWKLTDGVSKELIPIKGCLSDSGTPTATDYKSEICEKDFNGLTYSAKLDINTWGRNQDGTPQQIGQFINQTVSNDQNSKLHFEFLIVAPMEHVVNTTKYEIPYIDFTVKSNNANIPNPYFTIESDGYYRDYKQSITATISPKTTVPLFDFTIIQQE